MCENCKVYKPLAVVDVELPDVPAPLRPPLPLYCGAGPHIRTVASSDTEATMAGCLGFHVTQLTIPVWPERVATGSSRLWCQMYTLLSVESGSLGNQWST